MPCIVSFPLILFLVMFLAIVTACCFDLKFNICTAVNDRFTSRGPLEDH